VKSLKINAIGVVEVSFYTKSVVVMDAMLKAAEVELVSWHKLLGGRMTQSVIAGRTSDVDAAIEAAYKSKEVIGEQNLKIAVCISNPHPEVIKLLNMIKMNESEGDK